MTTFTIVLHPTDLMNANARTHWARKAAATSNLRIMGGSAWMAAGAPQMGTARLVVTISYPDRRRRDVANLAPTIKALVDGMTHPRPGVRGILPDDDDRHLIGPDLRVGGVTAGVFTLAFDWQEIS